MDIKPPIFKDPGKHISEIALFSLTYLKNNDIIVIYCPKELVDIKLLTYNICEHKEHSVGF